MKIFKKRVAVYGFVVTVHHRTTCVNVDIDFYILRSIYLAPWREPDRSCEQSRFISSIFELHGPFIRMVRLLHGWTDQKYVVPSSIRPRTAWTVPKTVPDERYRLKKPYMWKALKHVDLKHARAWTCRYGWTLTTLKRTHGRFKFKLSHEGARKRTRSTSMRSDHTVMKKKLANGIRRARI